MTPARAAGVRAERIEGKRLSRKEIREKLEKQRQSAASKWTIDRLWMEYRKQNGHLKGLFIDENRYKNYLEDSFGSMEPHQISPLEIDQFKSRLSKRGVADASVRNVMELLRLLINFGGKRSLCRVPSYLGELPRVNNQKTEDLTPAQHARLWEIFETDSNRTAANIMKFTLLTGMHRGELFRLKWSDIDFNHGFILIKDPKSGQDQKVPSSEAARKVLELQGNDSEYVFPGRRGRQRVHISKQVNRIKRVAGWPSSGMAISWPGITASPGHLWSASPAASTSSPLPLKNTERYVTGRIRKAILLK